MLIMEKTFTFTIKGTLPSLNEYIQVERSSKFGAASMKKSAQAKVIAYIEACKNRECFDKQVFITYKWYCPNKKKDKDNIAFAKKFIQHI